MPDFDYMDCEDIEADLLKEFKRRMKHYEYVDKMNYNYEYINKITDIKEYKVKTEKELKEIQDRRLNETWIKI